MAINTQIVTHLLNRMLDFNEWGQCSILQLVARYTPATEDEMYDVMVSQIPSVRCMPNISLGQNLLEDRLRHANAAVVLAATKVFLNFTKNLPEVHMAVFQRLKGTHSSGCVLHSSHVGVAAPLLTLMGSSSDELAFTVLSHIGVLVDRAPGVFDDDFKHFFCRCVVC